MSENAVASKIDVDNSEVSYTYANGANFTPMLEDCFIDFGTTSIIMPPNVSATEMTPETAKQVRFAFRHTNRIHMNWQTAKRLSGMLNQMVAAHESTFGEIMMAENQAPASPE